MIQPSAIPSAAAALLLSIADTPASAAFVSADTTTTNMGEQFSLVGSFAVEQISDSSCLTDPDNLQSNCSTDDSSGFNAYTWVSDSQAPGFIKFAFDTALEFVGVSIWNLNTSAATNGGRNVDQIGLSWSLDGSAFESFAFSINGGATGSSGSLTQVPNNNQSANLPDRIVFDPIVADLIRLDIQSGYGSTAVGLSEVAFNAAPPVPTPTPATLLLLAPALLWLGQHRGRHPR
jgi:hypothetical protein